MKNKYNNSYTNSNNSSNFKDINRTNCIERSIFKKQYIPRFNQGDCKICDGYDFTCKNYIAYNNNPKFVSTCKIKWNLGSLENKINEFK